MTHDESEIVRQLLWAYRQGMFPMADLDTGGLSWYSPDPRALVPIDAAPGEPGGVRFPRSLRSKIRSGRFTITTDRAFEWVMRACAEPRENEGGWIDEGMISMYTLLHQAGHAHSVEAWAQVDGHLGPETLLVGGLYGVHIGSAFFGESMFCRPEQGGTDASKVCFIHLISHLRARGFSLLDTQFSNPHMERLGIIEIPRTQYLQRLKEAVRVNAEWQPWTRTISAASPADAKPEELEGPKKG